MEYLSFVFSVKTEGRRKEGLIRKAYLYFYFVIYTTTTTPPTIMSQARSSAHHFYDTASIFIGLIHRLFCLWPRIDINIFPQKYTRLVFNIHISYVLTLSRLTASLTLPLLWGEFTTPASDINVSLFLPQMGLGLIANFVQKNTIG